jgi:hypothetical protein
MRRMHVGYLHTMWQGLHQHFVQAAALVPRQPQLLLAAVLLQAGLHHTKLLPAAQQAPSGAQPGEPLLRQATGRCLEQK